MQVKKILCITTVSTVLSGYLAVTQTGTAQGKESAIFSYNIDKTTDIKSLNSNDPEQLTENLSTNQLDQTTDSTNNGFPLEDNSDSQEFVENSTEISQQSDNGITQKATSTEESLNQTTSTTSSAEIQNSSSESNQINKGTEDGWNYDIRGDYAYITSSNLSGDVSVPSTLGGKPIRFERLDGSVFVNYQNITSFKVSSPFYAESVSFIGWTNVVSFDLNIISIGNNSTKEMFRELPKLQSINFHNFDTSNITDMSGMFYNCNRLSLLDLSNFKTSNVIDMSSMFYGCANLTTLDLSSFMTSNVQSMTGMFYGCSNLSTLDLSNFKTFKVTDMSFMFSFSGINTLDLKNFDTSKIRDMSYMFSYCYSLSDLDVSTWDTSQVTTMEAMFYNCNRLNSIDLSNWITSNVKSMRIMFGFCISLSSMNLSTWDTSKVTDMSSMFFGCTGFTRLDLSNFNTSSVTTMRWMFSRCTELTSLDAPNWNTTNVVDMMGMFENCPKFLKLDASKWNTSKVTNMDSMFRIENSYDEQVLVVQTNDQKLLVYDYAVDRRIPGGPMFNPAGGTFPDKTTITKSYYSSVAMTTDEYKNKNSLSSLKEFVRNNEPTKELTNFINWTDSSGNNIDNVTNVLDELDSKYTANWQSKSDPNIPDGSTRPDKVNPNSTLGIAYFPTKLSIPKTELNESGEQNIPIQTTSIHVGVKDYYASTSWTLRAQLKWDKNAFYGSSIHSDNNGKVYKNENNGNDPFTDNDLKDTTEAKGERYPTIDESESTIMSATNEKRTGVYDYSLGKLTLVIPETKYIEPNQYSGTIQWNLVSAP